MFVLPPAKSQIPIYKIRTVLSALFISFPKAQWDKYMEIYYEKHEMLYNLWCYFHKAQAKP